MRKLIFIIGITVLSVASLVAQNVGISNSSSFTTPQSPLHIYWTSDGNLLQLSRSTSANTGLTFSVNSNDFSILNRQNNSLIFGTNGTERMRITNTGNVGIGTTSPSSKLEVYGATQNIEISNTSETDAGIILNDAQATGSQYAKITYGSSDNDLNFLNASSTPRMVIESSGEVGIGTTSPSERLDVSGNVRFSGALMPNGDAGNAGKLLKSNGTGVAPSWVAGISLSDIHTVESTSSLAITSSTFTAIPGESITVNGLHTGDRVLVWFSGNMYMNGSDWNIVNVALYINGTMASVGGYVRTSIDSYYSYMTWQNYSAIARYHVTSNGNYTFEVRANRQYSGNTIYIGGNSSSAAEGILQIFVLRN